MTASGCQHIFSICSKLLARAIAACRPSSCLQSVHQVAVTVRNQSQPTAEHQISITISDTGKALPDDVKVLKTALAGLFIVGADSLCDQEVLVKSTEMHESSIRVYRVTPGTKSSSNPAVSIARLPVVAKQSRMPFAGSKLSLRLIPSVNAEDVISCVQAVLELSSMIAPHTCLELRLKGFSLEGHQEGKPGNVSMKYDIEPLPAGVTPEQRFFEGLKAWFEEDDDAAQQGCNDTDCGQSAHLHPHQLPAHLPLSHSQHQQYQQPGMYPDAAHQLLSSPMACDHLHQPHASYNHHGDEVAHQSDLAYGQQYEEEGEHMVLEDQSQACMMDQQHQHQHLAPQELYMQGLQYEACQRQYSQQDEMMVMNESEQENVAPNGQLLCQASSQSHSWVRQNAVTPEPPAGAQEQYQTQCSEEGIVGADHWSQANQMTRQEDDSWQHDGQEMYDPQEARVEMTNDDEGHGFQEQADAAAAHGQHGRPMLAIAIGQAGADAPRAGLGMKQPGVMLQRSKWTAQVGLVLHSRVPSPLTGYVLPQGNAQVYLFQNYAMLQRPHDTCLKALEKFTWQSFGLEVEDISALVLHLYNNDMKQEAATGKTAALAAVTEAKLIKTALEDALTKLKDHFQGSLCNKVERRLQQCLPYLAKSLSKLVIGSESADLQTHACHVMGCEMDCLQQEVELRLQDAAASELQEKGTLPM